MNFSAFSDDCLLAVFSELPLSYRLSTVPLVCRRWAGLQPLFSTSADTAADVVERLQTELPNIRRLSIVQLNRPSSALQPELLSLVEAFAGQLTSFAIYFKFKFYFHESELDLAVKQPVISANFHRLLTLINYEMPQLRHLILNTDQPFFFNDMLDISKMGYKIFAPGSLYLPVLRSLHTFSFKSPYHADILYYSLLKFAPENNHLKVRLAHVPFSNYNEGSTPEKLWKDEVVITNIKYLHLYDYFPCNDSNSLLPLFTTLSSSFPKLTTFSLHLGLLMKLVPADLPPLPRVTNLTLNWQFEDGFGAIFQPSRVFPALCRLTIVPYHCAEPISFHSHDYDLSTIQQALKPLKLYPRGALQHISINFCKEDCHGKRIVLTAEDL
ncbi:hypothetical protein TYRP_022663 [Tyrophagus putrescentiae]|nr:hypothetical protein TYRP_022663 [Tyrophagus putrescentiae]